MDFEVLMTIAPPRIAKGMETNYIANVSDSGDVVDIASARFSSESTQRRD